MFSRSVEGSVRGGMEDDVGTPREADENFKVCFGSFLCRAFQTS